MKARRISTGISGYAGFYKGHYLRSALEYAYAVLLDHQGISWEYELRTYQLSDGQVYKPDFFLEDGSIVEVKGEFRLAHDLPKIEACATEYGVTIKVVREGDIKAAYELEGLPYYPTISEWKTRAKRIGQDLSGEKNPRYGVAASEKCRTTIGSKAKDRWESPEYRAKMSESFKGRTNDHVREKRVEWLSLTCETCGTVFQVAPHKRTRKYCSMQCHTLHAQKGADAGKAIAEALGQQIKITAFEFAAQHPILVLSCPANRISTQLAECWKEIDQKHGVRDFRTISKAISGDQSGRKATLNVLKDHVQNIVRTAGN